MNYMKLFYLAARVCSLGAICLLLTPVAGAQTPGTGTIEGRVYNPASKQYVRNAEVRIEGTNLVDYTENDGSFRFTGVRSGPATVLVTYTGYVSVKESFVVTPGQVASREIQIVTTQAQDTVKSGKDSVVKLQAFTVSTEREGNAKAIMDQRRNMDITTSVSSDIFGDVTDGNVGEFLKYLPGVDLDYVESEARGPRLGGMDGQYVGVAFDGIRTASADANRGGGEASRATSFEGFSITSIESIEISRTASAESDADSPAGTINMKTRRAFDRKGRRLAFNASVNFNAEEFTLNRTPGPRDGTSYKWKPNLSLEYSEAFLNQRLGILLSVSRANSFTEQYQVNNTYNRNATAADPRSHVIRQIDFKDGPKFIQKDALMLTADFRATRRLVLSLNAIYTYTEGEFWNRNFTWVAANDNANVNNGRSRVGGDGVLNVVATRAPSGSVNNVATLNTGGGTSAKLTYTRTFAPKFEYKLDALTIDGAFTFSKSRNNYEANERGWVESEGGGVPSSWTASRPHAESWEWTIRQTSGEDWYDRGNFVNTNTRDGGTRVNNSGREWVTEIWNGQANATWALPFDRFPTKLKFGGKWNEESRKNYDTGPWMVYSYIGPGGNTVTFNPTTQVFQNATTGNWANLGYISPHPFDMGTTNALTVYNGAGTPGMPPRIDRQRVLQLFRTSPDLFVHTSTPDNFYTSFVSSRRNFRQTVTAGYTQADVAFSRKLTLRMGVRMENTLNEFTEFNPRLRSEIVAAGFPVNNAGRALTIPGLQYQFFSKPQAVRESEYRNWFPSAVMKFKPTPNLEFQLGANKAISRPPVDSLTGIRNIIEDIQRIDSPNADLQPEYSKNFQTRLAYYFQGRSPGQMSIALSQNDIRNLRETFDFTAEEFGEDDPEFATYTFRSTRNSAETRRFRNMELAYNQTLGFLPELFRGTNVNIAYTRTYASQRRNNLAPHRVSTRLGYAYRRFNGSIGMVWRDDSPDGIYGRYKGALTQFDLAATWKLSNRYSVYVQGRNITGKPVLWYESPPGVAEGVSPHLRVMQEYGANWVIGLRGTF
ncbi:MAG: TonB-dependent receptor [Opitutaceae bacterium]|nr:TonB-dependent receptor [Opitutaceae bacterium]